MSSTADDHLLARVGGVSAGVFALLWGIAAVATSVSIEFEINQTPELLRIVAEHRVLFVSANVIGLAAQFFAVPMLIGLAVVLTPARRLAWLGLGWWALSLPLFAFSATFHAVFGHIPARAAQGVSGPLNADLLRDADVLHHLGDFAYFAGVISVAVALLAWAPVLADDPRFGRGLAILGVVSAVCSLLQFGWLVGVDPLEYLGPPGLLGQLAFTFTIGWRLLQSAPHAAESSKR